MSKRVGRIQRYLAEGKDYKRWRFWHCLVGDSLNSRLVDAREEIWWLEGKGFKAKIWAPRPEHKTSGHTHIVVLSTFNELSELSGLPPMRK